jgi:hypothetical protein
MRSSEATPFFIAGDSLAVDDAGARAQACQCLNASVQPMQGSLRIGEDQSAGTEVRNDELEPARIISLPTVS